MKWSFANNRELHSAAENRLMNVTDRPDRFRDFRYVSNIDYVKTSALLVLSVFS